MFSMFQVHNSRKRFKYSASGFSALLNSWIRVNDMQLFKKNVLRIDANSDSKKF